MSYIKDILEGKEDNNKEVIETKIEARKLVVKSAKNQLQMTIAQTKENLLKKRAYFAETGNNFANVVATRQQLLSLEREAEAMALEFEEAIGKEK